MKLSQSVWLSLLVLIALAAAWRFWPRSDGRGDRQIVVPRMELSWVGEYSGKASLPLNFSWCPGKRIGMLEALSGDTGLLIIFHEADSIAPVSHLVLSPEMASVVPQWANAGLRLGRDSSVAGYYSMSGKVELSGSTSQVLGGSFTMTMRRPGKPDTLLVKGRFPPTAVVGRSAGCE